MRRLILTALALLLPLAASAADALDRNVAYGPDRAQRFDVYYDDTARGAPVIVMLHGGAWAIGDKSNRSVWKEKAVHWVDDGFVFISLNTRLLPEADPAVQAQDLARALSLIGQRAASWGGDPRRMIVMGHSAGAHLVTLLGTDRKLRATYHVPKVQGWISLDTAVLDTGAVMESDPPRLYRRAFGEDPAFWREVSPMAHLTRGDGPFLLVCSSRRATSCPEARRFAARAASLGDSATVLPVDLSHSGINGELGKPGAYTEAVDRWIAGVLR